MAFDAIYHAARVEQGDWDGYRLLSHEDAVYEAVTDGDVEARIHGDDDTWEAAVRFPVADDGEAYDAWDDVASGLAPSPDSTLHVDGLTFQEERADGPTRSAEGYTLRYNPDGDVATPEHAYESPVDSIPLFFGGGMLGWVPAFPLAIPADEVLGHAMAGEAVLGGVWAGLAAGLPAANYALPKAAGKIDTWRSKRRYGDPDRLQDETLLDRLNERNALERFLEEDGFDEALGDRYAELDHGNPDAELERLVETHFDRFDEQEGVIVSTRAGTYREAASLLDAVASPHDGDRPRVTRDPDAFRTVFDHLVVDDTVLTDGKELVRRALEGAHPDVEAFLDDRYGDVVRRVGAERTLED